MPQLKIREMPQDERPREKLAAHGASALTDPELIAILLRTGVAGKNVLEVARHLLKEFGSLGGLSRCTVDELATIRGVGFAKAVQLVAAFGLGQRLARETLSKQRSIRPSWSTNWSARRCAGCTRNRCASSCSIRAII